MPKPVVFDAEATKASLSQILGNLQSISDDFNQNPHITQYLTACEKYAITTDLHTVSLLFAGLAEVKTALEEAIASVDGDLKKILDYHAEVTAGARQSATNRGFRKINDYVYIMTVVFGGSICLTFHDAESKVLVTGPGIGCREIDIYDLDINKLVKIEEEAVKWLTENE